MEREITTVQRKGEQGFSMAELMIAMVVTLIVSGAVFGLITSGQTAFRREPAVTERQQNIRIAMDLITADVHRAGEGLGKFTQAFMPGLDGPAGAYMSPDNTNRTDHLRVWAPDENCPDIPLTGVSGANVNAAVSIPACYPDVNANPPTGPAPVMLFYGNGQMKVGWGHNAHSNDNDMLNFPPGQDPQDLQAKALECSVPNQNNKNACEAAGGTWAPPVKIGSASLYRWEIAADTDGVPSLYRTSKGGYDMNNDGVYVPAGPNAAVGAGWQLVARGIEDMQIRYMTHANYLAGGTTWLGSPPDVGTNYGNIVQQVEIVLAARTVNEGRLTGETTSATGVTAVRGQLRSVISPRAALIALQNSASPEPGVEPEWY